MAAGEGAKALAVKQREILHTAFRGTTQAVRDFKPMGNPTEVVANQSEFAKKAFEVRLQSSRDIAELVKKAVDDPATFIKERMHENLSELRDVLLRPSGVALSLRSADCWGKDQFPDAIVPKLAVLNPYIAGVGYEGYGATDGSWLLNEPIAMELARVDSSIATFWGVHTGLSAVTEPLVGSATSGGRLRCVVATGTNGFSTARRSGMAIRRSPTSMSSGLAMRPLSA